MTLGWLSGIIAFWLGVMLARINGYPLAGAISLPSSILMALGQGWILWFSPWGRLGLGALGLGLLPVWLGFYLASGHWVSELWIVGALLSLAALNTLLAQEWQPDQGQDRDWASRRALGFTLINILLLGGLVALWYLPPPPLPFQEGTWVLIALAVLNQEWIKRGFYRQPNRIVWLRYGAAGFQLGLTLWLLGVYWARL